MAYQPMTMVDLAGHLSRHPDEKVRWKHVWEFLEEYRWEPAENRAQLLVEEPSRTGDPKWGCVARRVGGAPRCEA